MDKTPTFQLNFDGGSRGNPGPAGIGFTIVDAHGNVVDEVGEFIGRCTNNVAEYTALVKGLEAAIQRGIKHLIIRADSELVVRQIQGIYRVKHPDLKPLHARAVQLLAKIPTWSFGHVYREANSRADQLANMAMDRQARIAFSAPLSQPN